MTLRKWITFASAAAMLAGVGACKDTGGGSSQSQGRRGETLPRARGADAGSDMTTSPGSSPTSPTTTPTSPSTPPSSTTSPSSSDTSSSGSSSDTKR